MEKVLGFFTGLGAWVLGLFPALPSPAWLTEGVAGGVAVLSTHLAGFGAWINFGAAAQAVGFVVACIGVALVIRCVRIVASFMTAGGGSAA